MARVLVTEPADEDTAEILTALAREAGVAVAERYLARFERLYDRLAAHPASCQARSQLGHDIRVCVIRPYLVIYVYDAGEETIHILRVLHGSRHISPSHVQA